MSLIAADAAFETRLRAVLPDAAFRPLTAKYLEEPRGRYQGQPGCLVAPATVAEVSTVLRLANQYHVGVVPYGGGTGLVGGQVMPEGPRPVILSLERMNEIRAVHGEENILIAEAGVILADIQAAATEANRLFPLSLAAEGTARIGGNLSTNAGGTGVLRYGNTRDLCLGLEAVLPNGDILHGLSRLRKDNTGYDLKNLLIGAEGTLGVITAASLKLSPVPGNSGTALMVVPSPRQALDLLNLARDQVGEAVSGFELISGMGLRFLQETLPDIRQPFDTPPEWCVLIELGLSAGAPAASALEQLFEAGADRGLVSDGLIAQSRWQQHAFWSVREHIPEGNRRIGAINSHDVSLPLSRIADFIDQATATVQRFGDFRINCFGHLGDGNLHFNVFPPKGVSRDQFDTMRNALKVAVHDLVHGFQGSVSAEHGIGRLKTGELQTYGDPVKLQMMRRIKAALDPNGIMNPGAVLAPN